MNSLEVKVDVGENFIHRIHAGQPAIVRLNAYPDWTIAAEVVTIVPTADRSKATVKVRFAFNRRSLRACRCIHVICARSGIKPLA